MEVGFKKVKPNANVTNPDAWARLIGPHNNASVVVNGHQTKALLDSGSMVSTISEKYCEEHGLEVLPIENVVEIEQAGGALLDYEGVTGINLKSLHLPGLDLDMGILVVPHIPYHDDVPLTLGTKTLSILVDSGLIPDQDSTPRNWRLAMKSIIAH